MNEPRRKDCEACWAPMVFLRNQISGKMVPVDAKTYSGEPFYDRTKHTSHYRTCTDPARFSRKIQDSPRDNNWH